MASKKRDLAFNTTHHIYNRGVLKKVIFHDMEDYKRFTGKLMKYKKKYPTKIIAFCLMPNHFHLLIREIGDEKPNVPSFMQQLQNSYAKYYARKYGYSGRLFQGTYKNKLIKNEPYYDGIIEYIQNNPVRSKLVRNSNDWKFKYP